MNHHLSLRKKIIIMISVMASLFLVALDQTIISTALGKIVEEFDAYSALSWVVTAYLITTTITTPIAGKLSDMFGRRLLLLIGVTIFAVASLFSGMAADINQLIIWRAVQGIGGGIITANAFTIIGDLFAARERGRWQGMIGAVFGVSSVVGPLLGGFLTESHQFLGMVTDWRWTFFINVPIGIAAFVVIAIYCPSLKHEKKPRVDYIGASLLAVALATLVLAVDNTDKIFADLLSSTGMSLTTLRIIMAAIVALSTAAFIYVERRSKEPILNLKFFKNRNFLLLSGIAVFVGAAMLGSIMYLTQFNQQVYGAGPTTSGLMLLPMIAGLMIVSITTGQLVSKYGKYKRFMVGGFIVATVAIGLLATLTPTSQFLQQAIIIFFVGAGIGAAMPLLNIAIQNEFEQKDIGMATSSSQLFRGLGSTIGVAVFGSMLTLGITSNLGDMNKDAYVQSLKQSPVASQILSDPNDVNTLLTLNMPTTKEKIDDGFTKNMASISIPITVKDKLQNEFTANQKAYGNKIVNAFSQSLHAIFIVTSIMMLGALILVTLLKERPLHAASPTETPGEI
ncbi:MAG: putative Drug resistance transporter, EmrB/QacA subfamily [Candidatus Saccharibacteria bacterium]|jgi:EmrB/QacA subfamily drug resistance transporter|nr:putative Drug resistance transporter, EmrB/QacA subfamily [Candidatus Saccharibacteria bacterium]